MTSGMFAEAIGLALTVPKNNKNWNNFLIIVYERMIWAFKLLQCFSCGK